MADLSHLRRTPDKPRLGARPFVAPKDRPTPDEAAAVARPVATAGVRPFAPGNFAAPGITPESPAAVASAAPGAGQVDQGGSRPEDAFAAAAAGEDSPESWMAPEAPLDEGPTEATDATPRSSAVGDFAAIADSREDAVPAGDAVFGPEDTIDAGTPADSGVWVGTVEAADGDDWIDPDTRIGADTRIDADTPIEPDEWVGADAGGATGDWVGAATQIEPDGWVGGETQIEPDDRVGGETPIEPDDRVGASEGFDAGEPTTADARIEPDTWSHADALIAADQAIEAETRDELDIPINAPAPDHAASPWWAGGDAERWRVGAGEEPAVRDEDWTDGPASRDAVDAAPAASPPEASAHQEYGWPSPPAAERAARAQGAPTSPVSSAEVAAVLEALADRIRHGEVALGSVPVGRGDAATLAAVLSALLGEGE